MKFVILGFDGPEGQIKRPLHRPAHLERIRQWDNEGRIVLAGPMTDKAGSLIIVEVASQEEAEKFAREDPYTLMGIFERVEVHPFHQVFPNPDSSRAL